MAHEPSLGELAEDVADLRTEMKVLAARFEDAPFVRRDLHQSEYGRVRDDIAGLRTLTMWTLGLLCSALIGAIVVLVIAVGRGGT